MSKKNRYMKIYIDGDLFRTTGADSHQFRKILYEYGVSAIEYGIIYYIPKYPNFFGDSNKNIMMMQQLCNKYNIKFISGFYDFGDERIIKIRRPKYRIDIIRQSSIALKYKETSPANKCPKAEMCPMVNKFVERSYYPKCSMLIVTTNKGNDYVMGERSLDYVRSKGFVNVIS